MKCFVCSETLERLERASDRSVFSMFITYRHRGQTRRFEVFELISSEKLEEWAKSTHDPIDAEVLEASSSRLENDGPIREIGPSNP